MTGQVLQESPLRFNMSYSIDTFSEYSSVAVGRSTPTRAIVAPSTSVAFNTRMDEELFRDLFGPEADSEQRDSAPDLRSPRSIKNTKSITPNKPIIWSTGATMTTPFAPTSELTLPPTLRRNQVSTPSLSLPAPYQDAAELLTARPSSMSDKEETPELLGLSCVPEIDEDNMDDAHESQKRVNWRADKVSRRVVEPASPGLTLKRHSPPSIQNETLKFLEKLDLNQLLAQPRPDVTTFLPANNQFSHSFHDYRSEEGNEHRGALRQVASNSTPQKSARKSSGRRDLLNPLPENASRLVHMAETYGTTAAWPRKARKETLERLSNPISGHTSTLQALSPESRKKREADLGEWTKSPGKKLSAKETKSLIDRLADASNVYEAVVTATRNGRTKSLVKGKNLTAARMASRTNQDDGVKSSNIDKKRRQTSNLSHRKAMMKEKLAGRGKVKTEQISFATSTFLTQHEDDQAKLATSAGSWSGRPGVAPQRPSNRKPANRLQHIPQRPTLPSSVRARISSSCVTPSKQAVPSNSRKQTNAQVSSTKPKSAVVVDKTPPKTKVPTCAGKKFPQRVKNIVQPQKPVALSSTSASRQVSGTLSGPAKNTSRRLRKESNVESCNVLMSQNPTPRSLLPRIQKPTSPLKKRNPAPVNRRFRIIQGGE